MYRDIYPHVDLKYSLDGDQLTEEYIVQDRATAEKITSIDEMVVASNVAYAMKEDGTVEFISTMDQTSVFKIPNPVMYEFENRESKNTGLHYEMTEEDGALILRKVMDQEGIDWLLNAHRQYPVVIDPTITIDTSTSASATANSFQRKTLYDSVHSRYWSFYYNGSGIEASYSVDGSSFTSAGAIPNRTDRDDDDQVVPNTNDFSVDANSGTVYVAFTNDNSIKTLQGTLGASSITWDTFVSPICKGTSESPYSYPYIALNSSGEIWVIARFKTGTEYSMVTAKASVASDNSSWEMTKSFTNDIQVQAITDDADYVYVGLNTSPGKVIRISKADFSTTITKTLSTGEEYVRALTEDDNYVYAGLITSPGKVVRISKSDFSTTTTKTFATGENNVYALTDDANYVYAGILIAPGKVVRISKSDFSTTTTKSLALGENLVFSLTDDADYVYAGLYTSPGKVVRISKSDFSTTITKTLATGENYANALSDDDTYVYAGLGTTPGKVVRISKSDFSTTTTITFSTGENNVNALSEDDNYVYAGLGISPGKVTRISKADFSTTTTKTLATGENTVYGIADDASYVYTALYTSPGKVVRISKSDYATATTKTLVSGDIQVLALSDDSDYVYAGLNSPPGKVVRIGKSNYSSTTTKTFATGENYVYAITDDANYVYAGLNSSPGRIVRISKSDFSTTTTKALASGENSIRALADDADYVYAGLYTNPGKVVRISKSDFSTTTTKTFTTGENMVFAITNDADYVYAGLNVSPGKVVRISKSDFSTTSTVTFATGENIVLCLSDDADYVYSGLYTTPGKVVRISKSDFSTTATKSFPSGQNYVYSITDDDTYVYAGLGNSPGIVGRISKSDFTTTSTRTLASGENSVRAMINDGVYVYAGVYTTPGKVVRLNIANFAVSASQTVSPTSVSSNVFGVMVPLSSARMFSIWIRDTGIEGCAWDTTDLRWENSSGSDCTAGANYDSIATGTTGITKNMSAVADPTNMYVHLVYTDPSDNMAYKKFNGAAWDGSATILDSSATCEFASISVDSSTNDLYASWIRANHIYFQKAAYSAGPNWTWDGSGTDWKTTTSGANSTSNYSYAGRGFVQWTENAGAPYNVNWDMLPASSAATISISSPSDISLGTITGTGISSTGEATWTVTTNNPNGYKLEWQASTAGMVNEYSDIIDAYTPAVADTPELWSVAASTSEWGGRLKSTSTDYASGIWGVDDSTNAKWLNVLSSGLFQIASRGSPTAGSGEVIQFKAQVGASKLQPTGTYTVNITVTATTL